MANKLIITHKSPDLDSCTAIWILKRFIFPNDKFEYKFVDVGERIKKLPNTIHVDTGGLDYDHHDTDEMISSASVVYKKNKLNDKALLKLLEFVVRVDHGKVKKEELHFMSTVNALNGLIGFDSLSTLNAALIILDGIYNSLQMEIDSQQLFNDGTEFSSKIGKGIGFRTENPHLRRLTYMKGYDIFLFKDSKTGFAGYKSDGCSKIDFSNLYNKLIKMEPDADWFLHSSKQLLLCGSSKAPQKNLTKYSLNQLIKIATKHA